jgi:uncharacterized membrane protein
MESVLMDWITMLVRWWHVLAGITWIGASFYFNWFDSLVRPTHSPTIRENNRGVLNEVHGGNFYYHEQYYPDQLPDQLHVHAWPSKMTFISGLLLLALIYWLGASSFMIDPRVANITPSMAIGISFGSIVVCWLIYDFLCRRTDNNRTVFWVMASLAVLASFAFQQVYGGRAAFISVGVMLGSMMGLNVWLVIAPKSIHMQQQLRSGMGYHRDDGNQAKRRSQHNNYFTIPVVITMLSNHFPTAYSHSLGWLILSLLMLSGWGFRHLLNIKYKHDRLQNGLLVLVILSLLSAIAVSLIRPAPLALPANAEKISDEQVMTVVRAHCMVCHAINPTQAGFNAPPQGMVLESTADLLAHYPKIIQRAIVTQDMPLANLTQMRDAERAILASWLAEHAPSQ